MLNILSLHQYRVRATKSSLLCMAVKVALYQAGTMVLACTCVGLLGIKDAHEGIANIGNMAC